MENNEKNLSPAESMDIIKNMIALAKNNLTDDGFHFLLWGVLVIAASLTQYGMAMFHYESNFIPWIIMPLVGAPVAIIYENRKNKKLQIRTHFDRIFGYLWMGAGITLFFIIYISVKNQLSPIPFILALVGLATFVSGNMLQFKSLIIGGIIFWIAALVSSFLEPAPQLLINAAATFLGYIIPGFLLWKNYKAQNNV